MKLLRLLFALLSSTRISGMCSKFENIVDLVKIFPSLKRESLCVSTKASLSL